MRKMKLIAFATLLASNSAVLAQDGMNDLEIAHTAYTAGVIDIRYAHLATALSDNPVVLEFAAAMLRDHTAVNDAALALVSELNVTPQDNDLSRALTDGATAKRSEMATLSGKEFDCAYAGNELAYHQLVNKTLEENFIPAATVPQLKDLLSEGLVTFRAHEQHAQMMVNELQCES